MKTYEQVIQTVASDAFSDYMGGGRVSFPAYTLVAWIYGVSANKAYADFEKEFNKIKNAYYDSRVSK